MASPVKSTKDKNQTDAVMEVLRLLAEASGRVLGDDDIKRHPGADLSLGQELTKPDGVRMLQRSIDADNAFVEVNHTFNYRPFDGARAMAIVIKRRFGAAVGRGTPSFFGMEPPQVVEVEVDFGVTEQVPWGRLGLHPAMGEEAYMSLGSTRHPELGDVFHAVAYVPKRFSGAIEQLMTECEAELKVNSIYRGKAITASPTPQFFDSGLVDPADVFYSDEVMSDIETYVWAHIRFPDKLRAKRMLGKRFTVVHGTYGVGKTLLINLTAYECVQWSRLHPEDPITPILVRPGIDNWVFAMQMARLCGRAIIFVEDIDVTFNPDNGGDLSVVLDQLDGMLTKGSNVSLVATTNFIERIPKGILRLGRTDAVIEIGLMDQGAFVRFVNRILGEDLEPDVDFDAVFEACANFTPSTIHEVLKRARLRSLVRNGGEFGQIGTNDLVYAAHSLYRQLALMEEAPEIRVRGTGIEQAMSELVAQVIDSTVLKNNSDNTIGTLAHE